MRRLIKVLALFIGIIVIEQIFETALSMLAFKSRNPRVLGWLIWYHKNVENPVMVRFFSGRSSRDALLHHVGRRSGKTYATPLTAHRSEDTIIIPLPYGTETDWLRNLQAAGQGVVELEGRSFTVNEPEVVPIDQVMPLLPPFLARIVKLHETEHALRLHVAESTEAVTVLSNPTYEFTVLIDAPVNAVFDYCRDPRRIYAEDPMMKVADATLTPEGVGTGAHLKAKMPLFTETVALEYTEVAPNRRIVFQGDPTMTFVGGGREISIPVHIFTWTFEPQNSGTRLDLVVEEQNPPRWYRILDRVFDRSFRKQVNDRLARIKAAAEEQATTTS